jgi:hypothetical protein
MRRIATITSFLGLIAVATVAWRTAGPAQGNPLQGSWISTGWEYDGTAASDPQRGLLVFTGNHYSMMFVFGNEPRPRYSGEALTDAETLAAYGSFVANSGRYSISGNEVTTVAYMAKDPNYMADFEENDVTLTFRIDGETLHLTWPETFGVGAQLKGTFRKIE